MSFVVNDGAMNVSTTSALVEPGVAYWERRKRISTFATGPGADPATIVYTEVEDEVWRAVAAELTPLWHEHASRDALAGIAALGLDPTRVPQLAEVTARLVPLTGFRFEAVPGLVETWQFFDHLGRGCFLSTQYVRWEGNPLYTPEPDVIHEVFGHAHVLACPRLAELHRQAGRAFGRLRTPEARQFVADVFWFSAEFGVVRERGRWRAYGAGLLSSIGELAQFATAATIVPLDIATMGTLAYDIDEYQPTLFGAADLDEVLAVVGGFFASCTDDSIKVLRGET